MTSSSNLSIREEIHPGAAALAEVRVLVVGDAMLDRYWFGAVDRISPEAPVPVVKVTRQEERLGGAANVALNVKSLGPGTTLMTVVGEDEAGQRLKQLVLKADINAMLAMDANCHTIVKLRVIGRSQQLLRVDFEVTPHHEALSAMLTQYEQVLNEHDVVLFSDYEKGGLTHVPRMIELARRAGKPVLVDPKGRDFSRYAGASAITPNRAELELAIGKWETESQLHERAHALRKQLQLDALILTRSEEGISLFDSADGLDRHLQFPAVTREVFDVTGAGDTVIATLAAMIGGGLPFHQAVSIANRAGGIVVGRFGTASVTYADLFQDADELLT